MADVMEPNEMQAILIDEEVVVDVSSDDEISIIGEHSAKFDDEHRCDLCCEGEFLIDKLLRYGGLINDKYRFVCDNCDKNFEHKSQLKKHSSTCSGPIPKNKNSVTASAKKKEEEVKICSECHKTFKSKGGLTKHVQNQHSGLTHTCEICKAEFSNFKQFNFHCLDHAKKKHYLYTCNVCNSKFSFKKSLERHQKHKCVVTI